MGPHLQRRPAEQVANPNARIRWSSMPPGSPSVGVPSCGCSRPNERSRSGLEQIRKRPARLDSVSVGEAIVAIAPKPMFSG